MSEQFDWCNLGEPPLRATQDIWHAVRQGSTLTVCGLPVADPDEEWRWTDKLGSRRPCDNCTRILALEADGSFEAAAPPPGWKPQLGLLPKIADRATMFLRALGVAEELLLPTPPDELHNIELDPDTDMLGNNVQGNCVFVAIERNRRIAAAALGVAITWLTAQQVVDKYQAYTGIKTAPGPGAVAQQAFNWVRKSAGWGGNKLLFFAGLPITERAIRQACSEFQSVITCELIRAPQEWPAKVWDLTPATIKLPVKGGHATPGGSYTKLRDFLKTWGYIVEVTPAFFAGAIDEIDVLVWDFQWASLTYARQVSLIADIQELTGKTWDGPAPANPPTPARSAVNYVAIPPVRILDTRSGVGLSGAFAPHAPRKVGVTGKGGIPANAVAVCGNLTVTGQKSSGYLSIGPDAQVNPTTSTLNFPLGDDRANAIAGVALNPDGTLAITLVGAGPAHALLDINGYFTP